MNYLKLANKYSTAKYTNFKSAKVRQQFIDYFVNQHHHEFIKSSPVVPYCDPTVAFVNAGNVNSSFDRATNSQKCIRVGGKHNDLSVVGTDGYHHTFFEMLGNWSFGDYFKKEACWMAWVLLTDVYKIDPKRLYVTYFEGSKTLGIPADEECRNIWREIGLSDDRILPFGVKDNFWEMGSTGPCGPCSEIHVDRLVTSDTNRSQFVNKDRPDLVELWNIVFIQYNRIESNKIVQLSRNHIDTGMGFERLLSILQNVETNYDTDLFMPIFDLIEQKTKCRPYNRSYDKSLNSYELDTAYRIIADHTRMITACLADNMFPDQNHKLRRILRKCLLISERVFHQNNLLFDTIPLVIDILGDTYTEMKTNHKNVLDLVSHEIELFTTLRRSSESDVKQILRECPALEELDLITSPGFVLGYNELKSFKNNATKLNANEVVFKLYDTYGLDNDAISDLTHVLNVKYNPQEFENLLNKTRERTKSTFSSVNSNIDKKAQFLQNAQKLKLPITNDSFKYIYSFDNEINSFRVSSLKSKVIAILDNNYNFIEDIHDIGEIFNIIVDNTNFYSEAGGQESDLGLIQISNSKFDVISTEKIDKYVLHCVKRNKDHDIYLDSHSTIEMIPDEKARSGNICNHTGVHLLNACAKNVLNCAIYQRSSAVTKNEFKLELGIFGNKVDVQDVANIENLVRNIITSSLPVKKYSVNSNELISIDNLTVIPGETYPDQNISIIEVSDSSLKFISREPCCGTHAENTNNLKDFCITNVKLSAKGCYVFYGVAGERACMIRLNGANVEAVLENDMKKSLDCTNFGELITKAQYLKNILDKNVSGEMLLPFTTQKNCMAILNLIQKQIKDISKSDLKSFIELEMKNVLAQKSDSPYIIHFLESSSLVDTVPLQKATRWCTDRPILVISLCGDILKARCCVPQEYKTEEFNAGKWMSIVAEIFDAKMSAPKGQNIEDVSNLKEKRVKKTVFDDKLEEALKSCDAFAGKKIVCSEKKTAKR